MSVGGSPGGFITLKAAEKLGLPEFPEAGSFHLVEPASVAVLGRRCGSRCCSGDVESNVVSWTLMVFDGEEAVVLVEKLLRRSVTGQPDTPEEGWG